MLIVAAIAFCLAAAFAAAVASARGRTARQAITQGARHKADSLRASAEREASAARAQATTQAREAALASRGRADEKLAKRSASLSRAEEKLSAAADDVEQLRDEVSARDTELNEWHKRIRAKRDRATGLRKDAGQKAQDGREKLEAKCGITADEAAERSAASWIEDATTASAARLRGIDPNDSQYAREADRLLGVAVGRYRNHFLTERLLSKINIDGSVVDMLTADDSRLLEVVQGVAGVQLNLSDDGDYVRLEGLDGVGREVARRALGRLGTKKRAREAAVADPSEWVTEIRAQLDREIMSLGKKAFKVLEIPRPHEEIVDLVGRLNYRTSYTQNQWLHAVEAAFLAGMIAEEMGLDVPLIRRATLMHDIGKALTHEIEGSHAVIGADIARRLGEDEVVANAIGAHHLDEPMNSPYAYLVAAADAMSGARPGARREQTEGFSSRLQDIERIGRSYRGVEQAYAVHGGRELRIYVDDFRISDLDTVEMSEEIASHISEELVFPGQIKVTVIRSTEAVAVAN